MRSVRGAVALLLLIAPSAADASPFEVSFDRPGFVVIEVMTEGTFVDVDFSMLYDGPSHAILAVLQSGRVVSGPGQLYSPGKLVGAEVEHEAISVMLVNDGTPQRGWESGIIAPSGRSKVVLFAAGSVTRWSFAVPSGVEWRIVSEGPTYALSSSPPARSWVALHASPVSTYVVTALREEIHIQNDLFGVFAPPTPGSTPQGLMVGAALKGPNQTWVCPCIIPDHGEQLSGPGLYEFEWTGLGATSQQVPLAAWADIRFD